MFENPRRGRQARNLKGNDPKILDLKSSSEQIIFRKLSLGAPVFLRLQPETWPLFLRARGHHPYPGETFRASLWPLRQYRLETCTRHQCPPGERVETRRSVILLSPRWGLDIGLTTLSWRSYATETFWHGETRWRWRWRWRSEQRKGLIICGALRVTSFLSYLTTPSFGFPH